jgi:hypothetical protein
MGDQVRGELDLIPANVRSHVIERDQQCCRVCGRFVEQPGIHHIIYRSQGGLHVVENLVTIGWLPGHDCHLPVVHANKRLWQPILQHIVTRDGLNGLQVLRAYQKAHHSQSGGRAL